MKIKEICAMVEAYNKIAEYTGGSKAVMRFTSDLIYYYGIKSFDEFKSMLKREYIKEFVKGILAEDFEIGHEKKVYWEVHRNGTFICSGTTPVQIDIEADD